MTIDPTNFEAQGLPTMEQVRTVWDAHPKPSSRTIADAMKRKGWDISYKTVSRWKKINFVEPAKDEPLLPGEGANHREVKKSLKAEIAKGQKPALVVDNTKSDAALDKAAEDGITKAVTGTAMTDEDLARIQLAREELKPKTTADLREEAERERLIYNIILLRESSRKANIQALIPKETSTLVASFSDDSKAAAPPPILPTGKPPEGGGDGSPPMIEGEFKVVSPTRAAIQRFLAKENA